MTAGLQRKQSVTNGGLLEVDWCAGQQADVDRSFAAIPVLQFYDLVALELPLSRMNDSQLCQDQFLNVDGGY